MCGDICVGMLVHMESLVQTWVAELCVGMRGDLCADMCALPCVTALLNPKAAKLVEL